ncbi:hypothetical protein ATANTOWER_028725 [Ataeniobius toweri]|uniref:ERAP1-like C-terminal domain-containing protein n=1 Tax=Ataeniobius toweri TaxID=208326 RepID=A0ABU7BVI9_9TELE|nr:hypothetical protein [Ataeniobius toweri]
MDKERIHHSDQCLIDFETLVHSPKQKLMKHSQLHMDIFWDSFSTSAICIYILLTRIHPNLKGMVYCSAIALGGVEEWDFVWRMFQNTYLASEASRLRSAMACTKTPWLLNRYLAYTLDPTKIRKQDATSTIQYIAHNVVGMPLAWNFVRSKWSYIFQQ